MEHLNTLYHCQPQALIMRVTIRECGHLCIVRTTAFTPKDTEKRHITTTLFLYVYSRNAHSGATITHNNTLHYSNRSQPVKKCAKKSGGCNNVCKRPAGVCNHPGAHIYPHTHGLGFARPSAANKHCNLMVNLHLNYVFAQCAHSMHSLQCRCARAFWHCLAI